MKIINKNGTEWTCEIATTFKLDKCDLYRIHDSLRQFVENELSFDDCVKFLEKNPSIMTLILSIGDVETEVGDEVYTKAKSNLEKYGNIFGKSE